MKKALFLFFFILCFPHSFTFAGKPHEDVELPTPKEMAAFRQFYQEYAPQSAQLPSNLSNTTPVDSFFSNFQRHYSNARAFDGEVKYSVLAKFVELTAIAQMLCDQAYTFHRMEFQGARIAPFIQTIEVYGQHIAPHFQVFQKLANTLFRHIYGFHPRSERYNLKLFRHPALGNGSLSFLQDEMGAVPYFIPDTASGFMPVPYGHTLISNELQLGLYVDPTTRQPIETSALIARPAGKYVKLHVFNGPDSAPAYTTARSTANIPVNHMALFTLNNIQVGPIIDAHLRESTALDKSVHFPLPASQEERDWANLYLFHKLQDKRNEMQAQRAEIRGLIGAYDKKLETGAPQAVIEQLKIKAKKSLQEADEKYNEFKEKVATLTGNGDDDALDRAIDNTERSLYQTFEQRERGKIQQEEAALEQSGAAIEARRKEKARKKKAKQKHRPDASITTDKNIGAGASEETVEDKEARYQTIIKEKFEQYRQTKRLKQDKFISLISQLLDDCPAHNLKDIRTRGSHLTFHAEDGRGVTYPRRHGGDDMVEVSHMNDVISGLLHMLCHES